MTKISPVAPYVLTFPYSQEGKDIKYRFMLTLSKPLGQAIGTERVGERLINTLGQLDGVDNISAPVGRYTIEVALARTFDPEVLIVEIERLLKEEVLSEIIRPPLITP